LVSSAAISATNWSSFFDTSNREIMGWSLKVTAEWFSVEQCIFRQHRTGFGVINFFITLLTFNRFQGYSIIVRKVTFASYLYEITWKCKSIMCLFVSFTSWWMSKVKINILKS
jgi:hypothetical protein